MTGATRWTPAGRLSAAALLGAIIAFGAAPSPGAASQDEVDALKRAFEEQSERIRQQKRKLERQQRALEEQRRRLETLEKERATAPEEKAPAVRSAVFRQPFGQSYPFAPHGSLYVPTQAQAQAQGQPERPVGQQPRQQRPEVPIIPERGGVLTPRGNLVVEPSVEWSHSNNNRFTFQGVEVIDTVLIGVIETQEVDRDIVTPSMGFRLGITDRIEAEVKVPYVYRTEDSTSAVVEQDPTPVTRSLDGNDIGDVEGAFHYQVNRGMDSWPFFVANLRVKSNTGSGPFDVDRGANGLETELATGSGFWSVEPSVTTIYPLDPAVLFANVGFLYNIAEDVNKQIGGAFVGRVRPGNAVRMAFGMGFALNEALSLSLGYQHDFIDGTEVETDGVFIESRDLDVGALNVGFNLQISDSVSLNTSVKVGATEDAPDISLLVRVPIVFSLFNGAAQ